MIGQRQNEANLSVSDLQGLTPATLAETITVVSELDNPSPVQSLLQGSVSRPRPNPYELLSAVGDELGPTKPWAIRPHTTLLARLACRNVYEGQITTCEAFSVTADAYRDQEFLPIGQARVLLWCAGVSSEAISEVFGMKRQYIHAMSRRLVDIVRANPTRRQRVEAGVAQWIRPLELFMQPNEPMQPDRLVNVTTILFWNTRLQKKVAEAATEMQEDIIADLCRRYLDVRQSIEFDPASGIMRLGQYCRGMAGTQLAESSGVSVKTVRDSLAKILAHISGSISTADLLAVEQFIMGAGQLKLTPADGITPAPRDDLPPLSLAANDYSGRWRPAPKDANARRKREPGTQAIRAVPRSQQAAAPAPTTIHGSQVEESALVTAGVRPEMTAAQPPTSPGGVAEATKESDATTELVTSLGRLGVHLHLDRQGMLALLRHARSHQTTARRDVGLDFVDASEALRNFLTGSDRPSIQQLDSLHRAVLWRFLGGRHGAPWSLRSMTAQARLSRRLAESGTTLEACLRQGIDLLADALE